MVITAQQSATRPQSPVGLGRPEEYYSRLAGLVSHDFHGRTIAVVGTGAGSYLVEKLARCGPAEIRLVDFDVVEWHNLCRTAFTVDDLDTPKVDALAKKIGRVNPFVHATTHPVGIGALDTEGQAALLAGVDLIVAGTDSFAAQALLNLLSQRHRVPAVFIGIHARAEGGRIIYSIPGETPCYRCVARERYSAFAERGDEITDLPSAHGALVDVQFIDMIALKVCLAILERGQDSALGRFWARLGGRNEIVVRTSPDYAFGNALWGAILSDLPSAPKPYARDLQEQALFAMDTVWLASERDPHCPDCAGGAAATGGQL